MNSTTLKKLALVLLASMLGFGVHSQESKSAAFSLQQAIDYAMKNSPNMLNAELDKQNGSHIDIDY